MLAQNFPVFAADRWAQDSSIRTNVIDFRCTIEIGKVIIHDGDLVFGDMDGVLIIPKEVAEECIEKSLEKAAGEKKVRKAIEGRECPEMSGRLPRQKEYIWQNRVHFRSGWRTMWPQPCRPWSREP